MPDDSRNEITYVVKKQHVDKYVEVQVALKSADVSMDDLIEKAKKIVDAKDK